MAVIHLTFLACVLVIFSKHVDGFTDYDYIKSESVVLTIRDIGADGSSRGNHAALADWMEVTMQRRDENVLLTLERNRNIQTDVPVSVYRNGQILYQEINDTEAVGFYYSLEPYATIMATSNTSAPLQLTGDVRLDDVTYRLHYHEGAGEYRLGVLADRRYRRDDYIIRSESSRQDLTDPEFTRFEKEEERINKPLYEVEILAVADFSEYMFWLQAATETDSTLPFIQRDLAAKEKLRQYIAFVLNGVDLRYRSITTRNYNIRILFSGLHIADQKGSSPWTENNRRNLLSPVQVDSDAVLLDFTDWCEENEAHLTGHDHAMLFTKYDMTRIVNGTSNTDIVGMSTVGDICLKQKQSLIEDNFGEDVSLTAAHELGHNLGAVHDGIHDLCLERDGYIMSAVITHNQPLLRNHWKFSTCSQYYFYRTIQDLNAINMNCMATRESNANLLPEYNNKLPGQIYGPDEQCEYIYGRGSYLYRQGYKLDYTSICITLKCTDPAETGFHYLTDTMEGTSCGTGKLCRSGYCVVDPIADAGITDECPFGDSPETSHGSSVDCPAILNAPYWSAYVRCQNNQYSCCETCPNLRLKTTATPTTSPTVTRSTRTTEKIQKGQPSVGECITSCDGVEDGEYQSCKGCHVYASCFYNVLYDGRPCQPHLVWSDDFKRCEFTSNTCEI